MGTKLKYYDIEHEPVPPYKVVIVDQFQGHSEYGYGTWGEFDSLEEAIAEARRITETAIKSSGSIQDWLGMGEAGLVYDAEGLLIWDGVMEYKNKPAI